MERIKCATFNKELQDSIPKEIREKMKADRTKAEKEQKTKAKTLPIQNVINCPFCGSSNTSNIEGIMWCSNCNADGF